MRIFSLVRHEDVSGVSGTGRVADGVEFNDGTVVLRWLTMGGSTGARFGAGAERMLHRDRNFHFDVDAEIIVFGSTKPDAHVTLSGEPVKEFRLDPLWAPYAPALNTLDQEPHARLAIGCARPPKFTLSLVT